MVIKGRERDTHYLSITDGEWPSVQRGLDAWLANDNFDAEGRQRRTLEQCREGA